MRKLLLLLGTCTLCFDVWSQSLSIDDLWNTYQDHAMAKEKATTVAMQREQVRIRSAEKSPVIYGEVDLQRNLVIPSTPVPAIAFDPDADEGAILPLKFSTKWNSKAGVKLEWSLFEPSRKSNLESDQLALERATLEEREVMQDLKSEATLAYAGVVLATHQYQLAVEDSTQYAQIKQVIGDRYRAGRAPSDEYILAQQEFERKRIRLHEAWTILQEANFQLYEYIDLDDIQVLSSDLQEIRNRLVGYSKHEYQIEILQLDRESARIDQKSLRDNLLPTLRFNAYLGTQFFSNELRITDNHNWHGHSFVNLGLQIPISAYFNQSSNRKKAALQQRIIGYRIQQEILETNLDARQRTHRLELAEQRSEIMKKIAQLAQQKKTEKWEAYRAGRVLLSEYNQAHSEHLAAQQDVWQAEYDWLAEILDSAEQ